MRSSDTINRIAAALLPHVRSAEAADVLLDAARLNAEITELSATLTPKAALAYRKGPVEKAVTAAAATTDPATLMAFAKDTRYTVQRFVVARIDSLVEQGASPESFADVLARLTEQAYKRAEASGLQYPDAELLRITAKHLPIQELLVHAGNRMFPTDSVRERLLGTQLEHEHRAVLGSVEPTLCATVLEVCNHHPVGSLTFADALAAIETNPARSAAIRIAFLTAHPVGAELAAAFLSLGEESWSSLPLRPGRRTVRYYSHMPAYGSLCSYVPGGGAPVDADGGEEPEAVPVNPRFTVAAAEMLLAPGVVPDEALEWVLQYHLPEESLDTALARLSGITEPHPVSAFAEANGPLLDARRLETFLDTMRRDGWLKEAWVTHPFSEAIPADLAAPVLFELLNRLDYTTTYRWLSGALARKPVPGEVAAWLRHNPESRPRVREHLSYCVSRGLGGIVDSMAAEAVDGCGSDLGRLVLRSADVARHVAQRLESGLGSDAEMWTALISMCEELGDERLESLVSAVKITLGRADPSQDPEMESEPEMEVFERADGQLSFLP